MIRIRGTVEARRCGAVAVRSQVITWNSTLTLYALYLPLPPPLVPAPPLVSQAWVLIATLVTLTRGIQGCPKITSFDKSSWHPIWKTSLYSSLFLPLYTRTFSQHPLPKNALPPSSVINPRILFPFFFSLQFFQPSLMNANYLCRRIFGTSLLTLFGVSLVLWRRERQITSIATPFYCPLSPNSQTSEFLIYSFCTFKKFC